MATFEELMAKAKARTTQQEETLRKVAAAKDRQERQRRLEGERKEGEKLRLEKARLEKQRAEDAAREVRLEQERERRQSDRVTLHKPGKPSSATASRGGTPSIGGSKAKAAVAELDGEARRELERKERAARARAKLFEGEEDDPPPVRPNARKATPAGGGKGKGKPVKSRRGAGGHPAECSLIRLNTTPRDIRTISEVERDMRLRKTGSADVQMAEPGDERALWSDPRALAKAPDHRHPPPHSHPEAVAAQEQRRKAPDPSQPLPPASKDLEEAKAAKKRSRRGSDEEPRKRQDVEDYRNEIWAIMGKDRSAYVGLSDDDDDEDMEARAADVFVEEGRSSRLAKSEDQREQVALQRHAQEKRARLAAGGGGRGGGRR